MKTAPIVVLALVLAAGGEAAFAAGPRAPPPPPGAPPPPPRPARAAPASGAVGFVVSKECMGCGAGGRARKYQGAVRAGGGGRPDFPPPQRSAQRHPAIRRRSGAPSVGNRRADPRGQA